MKDNDFQILLKMVNDLRTDLEKAQTELAELQETVGGLQVVNRIKEKESR